MAVNFNTLAAQIATGLGQPSASDEVKGFAHGVLDELTMSGLATFGGTPSPHPISGMTGSSMANRIMSYVGYPNVSPQLLNFCTGICNHIQTAGIVTYTGPTPPAVPNYFLGGTVSGLSGSAMASLVQAAVGYPSITPQLLGLCDAIATHIISNAQVVSGVIS